MPPDLAEKVAAMGRVVDPENTGKLYAPLQEKEPYAGVKVSRDVKYGSDPRNVVDIFVPETGTPDKRIERSSTRLAVWLPDPLTVAT